MVMRMKTFNYKIIWEHDGETEIIYAFTEKDVQEIKNSIESGPYKTTKIKVEKL
jgi:acylphosphatase